MSASSSSSVAPARSGVFRSHSRAREETRAQLPVGGQPDPVAGRAERLRDGFTKPISPAPSAKRNRRAVEDAFAGISSSGQRSSISARISSPVSTWSARQRLVGVERHELDEADDVRLAARELGERGHLLLGEALDRDAVDLDRAQLGVALGRLEPAQHLVERVAPRDLREAHV